MSSVIQYWRIDERKEVLGALIALDDFVSNPKKYGCTINLGDEENYEKNLAPLRDRVHDVIDKFNVPPNSSN